MPYYLLPFSPRGFTYALVIWTQTYHHLSLSQCVCVLCNNIRFRERASQSDTLAVAPLKLCKCLPGRQTHTNALHVYGDMIYRHLFWCAVWCHCCALNKANACSINIYISDAARRWCHQLAKCDAKKRREFSFESLHTVTHYICHRTWTSCCYWQKPERKLHFLFLDAYINIAVINRVNIAHWKN